MKFNWNQSGMPSAMVDRLRPRDGVASEPKGGSVAAAELEKTAKALEDANSRYERLVAELSRRGIAVDSGQVVEPVSDAPAMVTPEDILGMKGGEIRGQTGEWEDWERKFQSLLG